MSTFLSLLVTVLTSLAKAWFGEQVAASNEQQVGALKAENNAEQVAVQAVKAADAVVPLTADELSKHNASNDPDFRD